MEASAVFAFGAGKWNSLRPRARTSRRNRAPRSRRVRAGHGLCAQRLALVVDDRARDVQRYHARALAPRRNKDVSMRLAVDALNLRNDRRGMGRVVRSVLRVA